MSSNDIKKGRGSSPADPLRYLRRLYPRGPSKRQMDRTLDLMKQLALQPTDSIFALLALLEAYLSMIEEACQEIRRSTRSILIRSCMAAIVSGCVVACPILLVGYRLNGVLDQGLMNPPKADPDMHVMPFQAFVDATMRHMNEADAQRFATSADAQAIVGLLGRASDDQLQAIRKYLTQPTQPAR